MRLDDAIQRYVTSKDNEQTRKHYGWVLTYIRDFLGDAVYVSDVTPEMLDDWRAAERERGLAITTLASHAKRLKAFFNWCEMRGYTDRSPARHLPSHMPVKQLKIREKAIPEDVLRKMLALAQENPRPFYRLRDTAIMAIFMQYGWRRGGIAHLRTSGIYGGVISTQEKGGDVEEWPLTDAVWEHLAPWLAYRLDLETNPYHNSVFVSTRHTMHQEDGRYPALPPDGVSKVVRRLSKKAGANFGPHSIRHWKGISIAESRGIYAAQKVLKHEEIGTTEKYYAHSGMEYLESILDTDGSLRPPDGKIIHLPALTERTGTGSNQT